MDAADVAKRMAAEAFLDRNDNRVRFERTEVWMEATAKAKREAAENPPTDDKSKKQTTDGQNTQIELANRFIEEHENDWRYNVDRRQWYHWNGKVWEADERNYIHVVVKDFLKEEFINFVDTTPMARVPAFSKFIASQNTARGIRDVLSIAAPSMTIRDEDLDREPYLLVCQNGVLDLKTKELREHHREDYCTRITNIVYDPKAKCPLWKKHIEIILGNDKELIDNVQELLGYALFYGNPDAVFPVFFGSGRNGKTVTTNVLSQILGGYSVSISPEAIMRGGEKAGSGRLDMKGARLITANEPAESSKGRSEIDTSFIKAATGDDDVSGRRLYCEGKTFKIQGLVILSTNSPPQIHDQSIAIWDRVWRVPFTHYFKEDERVVNMAHNLMEEAPGILNWLLTGFDRYKKKGRLKRCKAIETETIEYRSEEDFYTEFFEEKKSGVIKSDRGEISASTLFEKYVVWFERRYGDKRKPPTQTKFGRDMSSRFEKVKRNDKAVYLGIREREQSEVSS